MKKILSILLALTMIVGLAASALAGSIEITHDEKYEDGEGEARVYLAYKIFDADKALDGENSQDDKDEFGYDEDEAIAYSIANDSPWLDVMLADAQEWFDVVAAADGSKYTVTLKEGVTNDATTAKAIADYLNENIPDDAESVEVTVDGSAVSVDDGYYLLVEKNANDENETDGNTVLALITTDVKMVEKNSYIYTEKTASTTNLQIGDYVEYTAKVTIPKDTKIGSEIVLHDTMDPELRFVNETKENDDEHGYSAVDKDDAAFTEFELTTATEDECTFEITITVTEDMLDGEYTFTYYAELLSTAADDHGYVNELYGETNGYKTVPDKPEVKTFKIDVTKKFVGDEENTELTATFQLRTDADDEGTAIPMIEGESYNYIVADSTSVDSADTDMVFVNGEKMSINGLGEGTYYLVEIETSTGYNILTAPKTIEVVVNEDEETGEVTASIKIDGEESDTMELEIENKSGSVLPSTGGIGTTIFYIVGGLLAVGAGVVLVTKKRMSKEDI